MAGLFYETGMIDAEAFARCTAEFERDSKSLMEVLNQDVSLRSIVELQAVSVRGIRDLLMTDLFPARQKEKEKEERGKSQRTPSSSLRDALSQPFYLTDQEMKSILNAWTPPVEGMLSMLHEVSALDESPENVIDELGKGEGVYNRLVEKGYLQPKTVNRAVSAARYQFKTLNRLLLALELLEYNEILEKQDCAEIMRRFREEGPASVPRMNEEIRAFIESEPQMPEIPVTSVSPSEALRDSLPSSFVRQNLFLPHQHVQQPADHLEIVTPDPFYVELTDTLAFLTGVPVVGYYAPEHEVINRAGQLYPDGTAHARASAAPSAENPAQEQYQPAPEAPTARQERGAIWVATTPKPEQMADSHSAVTLVTSVIEGGVEHSATDIHIEPSPRGSRVRYRIDGRLRSVMEIPPSQVLSVNSRIKVIAGLDVTERRRPQDGHFSLGIGEGAFDFRVSTLPTHLGEKTVIRILDESRVMGSLEELGMPKEQYKTVEKWITRPHGLLLVTGPTGSGKTSTLYAALNTISSEARNVVTIEDPVEYRLEGINQVQVDAAFDLSFSKGLRSILRQDPDVIMVGEVRDSDTARIAMRAALTGHLVFSTLHTNTAAGAIATLTNMGIEPYMLTSGITGVINQRLIRQVCVECKESFIPKKALLNQLGLSPNSRKHMYRGKGCVECLGTGYKGRSGVFEIMPMTRPLSEAILAGKSEQDLMDIIKEAGHDCLWDAAIKKVYAGATSPEEILETLAIEE
ncbi:type II/IV secretion system protein [bacterium]|nr:type II/IV secretion system protein [bacterium]